jgi:hypothetical protein
MPTFAAAQRRPEEEDADEVVVDANRNKGLTAEGRELKKLLKATGLTDSDEEGDSDRDSDDSSPDPTAITPPSSDVSAAPQKE